MILSRNQIEEIIKGHEWDDGVISNDIQELAKSHEVLREYSIKLTKLMEQNLFCLSKDMITQFLTIRA